MLILLALTFMLWTSTPFVQAQETPYALQVGAGGDDASRGNSGMAARIRTHVYSISAADYGFYIFAFIPVIIKPTLAAVITGLLIRGLIKIADGFQVIILR